MTYIFALGCIPSVLVNWVSNKITSGLKYIFMFVRRYNEIKEKLTPYLKKCGFNPKQDLYYLPVSGFTGVNLKNKNMEVCPWYE